MPYYPDLNCLFVHIPKTAGTSIASELAKHSSFHTFKHTKPERLKIEKEWEKCFKFSFVRNPWSLMVSSYHWWQQKSQKFPQFRDQTERVLRMNFSEFIQSEFGDKINEIPGSYSNWLLLNGEEYLDFIGKVETINQDWKTICEALDIPFVDLPVLNQSDHEHYRSYYDERSKDKIAERFRWSIDKFKYEF